MLLTAPPNLPPRPLVQPSLALEEIEVEAWTLSELTRRRGAKEPPTRDWAVAKDDNFTGAAKLVRQPRQPVGVTNMNLL